MPRKKRTTKDRSKPRKKASNRGGFRPNAGRKPSGRPPTVSLSLRLPPDDIAALDAIHAQHQRMRPDDPVSRSGLAARILIHAIHHSPGTPNTAPIPTIPSTNNNPTPSTRRDDSSPSGGSQAGGAGGENDGGSEGGISF